MQRPNCVQALSWVSQIGKANKQEIFAGTVLEQGCQEGKKGMEKQENKAKPWDHSLEPNKEPSKIIHLVELMRDSKLQGRGGKK